MIYFTSDLHFNHKFMARLRGFLDENGEPDIETMNAAMIQQWNDLIQPNDEVWVLGDFAFGPKEVGLAQLKSLNGIKTLIIGNHDAPAIVKSGYWDSVHKYKSKRWTVDKEKYSAFCCHYPMLTWPNAQKGVFHLHGHSHGNLPPNNNTRIDVGIDATHQIAVSSDWVMEEMSKRSYDMVDHHGNDDGYYGP